MIYSRKWVARAERPGTEHLAGGAANLGSRAARPQNADLAAGTANLAPRAARPRTGFLAAGAAILALAVAGCATASAGGSASAAASSSGGSATGQSVDLSQVTLNIGDQAGAGSQALLTAAGLIGKLPFKASWSDFTSGPPMLQAMSGGSVDVGTVGNAPPVFAAAGGEAIAIVGALRQDPGGTGLLVPANSAITSIAQLRGKRIAVTQGSSSNYHLVTVLKQAGLTTHDVTVVNLPPAAALAAFASGQVDAWDIWSPFLEEAQVTNHARELVNGAGYGSPYGFTVASRTALASPEKKAAIRAYLKLLAQARAWAAANQPAWAAIWAKATGLPSSIMVKAAADAASTAIPITPAVITSEQQVADAFTAAGLIPGKVDIASFTDTSFNDTAPGPTP